MVKVDAGFVDVVGASGRGDIGIGRHSIVAMVAAVGFVLDLAEFGHKEVKVVNFDTPRCLCKLVLISGN